MPRIQVGNKHSSTGTCGGTWTREKSRESLPEIPRESICPYGYDQSPTLYASRQDDSISTALNSGVGVRLKVGINIEKSEGVAFPVGGLGLAPEKSQFCAKNYAILSKFWYFFPILSEKVGDYPQS